VLGVKRHTDPPFPDFGLDFAVVDVETTGLNAANDRVVQVAIEHVERSGAVGQRWSTLVNPERDPGAVHIHGITSASLVGAPLFAGVQIDINRLLSQRVFVAHNASFDWDFISAELARVGSAANVVQRLCTMGLARRLELPVPNHKLSTLAAYFGVRQLRSHDASDDARVAAEVLRYLLFEAARMRVVLPLSRCLPRSPSISTPWVLRAPKADSPWIDPGPWLPGAPLVQGARFVVTGPTVTERGILYSNAIAAGLVPMNSVSGRTRFAVSAPHAPQSNKLLECADRSIPVIEETWFLSLLANVTMGSTIKPPAAKRVPVARGPLSGKRILVVGGQHDDAARLREMISSLGASTAINLTASVTHIVALVGASSHPKWAAAAGSGLPTLDPLTWNETAGVVHVASDSDDGLVADASDEPTPLQRGEVRDLPDDLERIDAFVTWAGADLADPVSLDIHVFVIDENERVLDDDHFLFYNNISTPEQAIVLHLDTPGEAAVHIQFDRLPRRAARVVITATSADGRTFEQVGAVGLLLSDESGMMVARGTCDAATTELSMIITEIYRRGDIWRTRLIGQGYGHGLRELAERYGVTVG
jgi:DNA polymerase-3 subunit epsilon